MRTLYNLYEKVKITHNCGTTDGILFDRALVVVSKLNFKEADTFYTMHWDAFIVLYFVLFTEFLRLDFTILPKTYRLIMSLSYIYMEFKGLIRSLQQFSFSKCLSLIVHLCPLVINICVKCLESLRPLVIKVTILWDFHIELDTTVLEVF